MIRWRMKIQMFRLEAQHFGLDEDLKYDSKIVFTTPFGNKFNNKDFKRPDLSYLLYIT